MRSTQDQPSAFRVHSHLYWIAALGLILVMLVYFVSPSSLLVICIAALLGLLIQYFFQSMFLSKKTSFFLAFLTWGGGFLYITSALNGINSIMFGALIVAMGIYLYR